MSAGATELMRALKARTQELVRDLSAESERLSQLAEAIEVDPHEGELARQISAIENDNRSLSERCSALERQTNALTHLYAVLYRLHESQDEKSVILSVEEIINGLVGCEELVIVEITETGALAPLSWQGLEPQTLQALLHAKGDVARSMSSGRAMFRDANDLEPEQVTACVPLRSQGRVSGAIVLYRMLPQKPALAALDRELLELLAVHAGRAFDFARLQTRKAS